MAIFSANFVLYLIWREAFIATSPKKGKSRGQLGRSSTMKSLYTKYLHTFQDDFENHTKTKKAIYQKCDGQMDGLMDGPCIVVCLPVNK